MKNNFRKLCFLALCFFWFQGFGQNDFFFNHYALNPSYFNPAWSGMEDQAFVAAHHRTQWAGYDATFDPGSAPSTQLVNVGIPSQGIISGLGLVVVNDQQFGLRSNQLRFQVAFERSLNRGRLLLGLSPSLNIQTIDPGDFRPSEPEDFGTRQSQSRPNIHAGILYHSDARRYSLGVSVENIIEPTFDINGFDQLDYFTRNFHLFFQKELTITRDISLKPAALLRSDLNTYSLDITGILEYKEKMWGGLSFKRSEALSLLLGYAFLEGGKLRAGYSFDYVVSEQEAKEPTSHEVFIRYNLPDIIFGGRKAVKTPRFSF